MKKLFAVIITLGTLAGCGVTKPAAETRPKLYEVLTEQANGGANIAFNEIITDRQEMNMLLSDEHLKGKISPDDYKTATFVILNLGEKHSGGYGITVEKVEELPDKIVVTVKELKPAPGSMVTQALTYPYAVVRINSRKPVEVR